MEGLPTNLPALKELCVNFLAKTTIIHRGPTIDVSEFVPGFILQMKSISSMLKSSMDLPLPLLNYITLIHIYLFFHK